MWNKYLNNRRLREEGDPEVGDEGNEFLSDYYRVTFSSSFRRLQDKTQVSPLAATDFVRRRLTHSFEVAVVGERMGRVLAKKLSERVGEDNRDKIGKIVATACLLHDIGNPPFGHEGEVAIREWADEQKIDMADYRAFDGNAQGFRIAVRLQHHGKNMGLNLTPATLSTMVKYPNQSNYDITTHIDLTKRGKSSVMSSEQRYFEEVTKRVGVKKGNRHPLAYIVEAADDIVNRLVDIEDAFKLKLISFEEINERLSIIDTPSVKKLLQKMVQRSKQKSIGSKSEKQLWAYQNFRVHATSLLADSCEKEFEKNIDDIEDGQYANDLVGNCELSNLYEEIKKLEDEKIFNDPSIVRIEAGGKNAIKGLLNIFYSEIKQETKLSKTVPSYFVSDKYDVNCDEEEVNVRRVVDYISGMTDRYAVSLYQELSGLSL
ncbi:MAG: dNTP triphosphohydrolase [Balneolales bacterium]